MSELDTFVQLFAAFYVTLSVENQIFRQFWTPAYYKTVINLMPQYGFRNSSRFHQQFIDRIQELSHDLETESRKKGACMLMVCIVLLGYSIFFPEDSETPVFHYLSLTTYAILSLVGIICSHYWFKRWRYVVLYGLFSLFLAIIFFFFFKKWLYSIDTQESYKELWEVVTKTCIILVLILPIVWQLFINWLYSEVYQRHLISLLNTEADLYRRFWKAYFKGEQSGIPDAYKDVLLAAFMNGTSLDLKVTEITRTLYERLLKACNRPRIRELLCYVGKTCEGIKSIDNELELHDLQDIDEQVPAQPAQLKKTDSRSSLRNSMQRPTKKRR